MRFFSGQSTIDFLGLRRVAIFFSTLLMLVGVGSLFFHGGPNYGIDFKGGSLIQVKFKQPVPPGEVRAALKSIAIGDFSVQEFGVPEEIIINVEQSGSDENSVGERVRAALTESYGDSFVVERIEMVGPKVGSDLREKAVLSIIYALCGILLYITFRFEFKYGVAAIAALAHDTFITIGAFSIFDKAFTLPVIAALLTVIGYSLNDTIVVFDRVRENVKLKRGMKLEDVLNLSINQTLSRTLLTSGTTLAVVLAIFFLGGEVIHDFAFALLVGVGIGTYSSIYVASPLLLLWERQVATKRKKKKG